MRPIRMLLDAYLIPCIVEASEECSKSYDISFTIKLYERVSVGIGLYWWSLVVTHQRNDETIDLKCNFVNMSYAR